jgi:hypothetical protein
MITGNYTLAPDSSWALLQLQEVRLECDTTLGPVTINIPEISALAISTNLKLFIVDATANSNINNITINASGLDTFDDNTTATLILNTNGSSVSIQNVAITQWIAVESVSAGGINQDYALVSGPFTPNSVSTLLQSTNTVSFTGRQYDIYNFMAKVEVSGSSVYAELMGFVSVSPGPYRIYNISQKGVFLSEDEFYSGAPIRTTSPLSIRGLVTDEFAFVPTATPISFVTVTLDNNILTGDDWFLVLLMDTLGDGPFDFATTAWVQIEIAVTSGFAVNYTPA